jgi:hypothetical protein
MTQTKRLKSPRWSAIAMLGLIFCVGSSATWWIFRTTAERSLNEKLRSLSDKGLPIDDASTAMLHRQLTSAENLDQWLTVLNTLSSKDYESRSSSLPIVGTDESSIPQPVEPWQEEAQAEQFMQQFDIAVKSLLELSQDNGPVRFPIQFNSVNTLLPYTQNMRAAARILQLESVLAARAGDAEREFRAINGIIGCALANRGEPFFVSQLVSFAIHGMAIRQIQSAVESNRLTTEQFAKLRARLSPFSDIRSPFIASLKGELGTASASKLILHSGLGDRTARKHAERLEAALEIQTKDLQSFLADCENWVQDSDSGGLVRRLEDSLGQYCSPGLSNFSTTLVRVKMSNDLAILAIATRQFELTNGQLPSGLNELESQGIDLTLFHCLDGNLPGYVRSDSIGLDSETGRAILWSFDPRPSSDNPTLNLPASPPPKTEKSRNKQVEFEALPWRWDLQ